MHDVMTRHESLRTVFPESDGVPRQEILAAADVRTFLEPTSTTESRLADELNALSDTAFDISREVPVRARLYRLGADEHVLAVVLHHIASDGWSMGPLWRDLARAYTARHQGAAPDWAPLPVQYADYAIWQRLRLGSENDSSSRLARQLAYWQATLAEQPVPLPTDHPRVGASAPAATVPLRVGARVHDDLLGVAHRARASLFMVV